MIWVALHGFLGRPEDWKPVFNEIRTLIPNENHIFIAPDYFNIKKLSPKNSFENFAIHFAEYLAEIKELNPQHKINLMGYSLGGRLILNSLAEKPDLNFDHAFIVASQWGLPTEDEKLSRHNFDKKWEKNFSNQEWSSLLSDWNGQNIFAGSVNEPTRIENQYDRKNLALSLTNWSLAKQPYTPPSTLDLKKIHFFVGENDKKYLNLYQSEKPEFPFSTVSNSGHRIIFDNPKELAKKITSLF